MQRVCLGLLALAAIGCGSDNSTRPVAPADFDADRARQTLTMVLDAWKRGEARRSPSVRFADDDFAAGLRLVEYELVEPDTPIEPAKDVRVNLSLRDARGRAARREISYQVATSPGLAVMRSDP